LEAEEEALKVQLEDAELQKLKLDDQITKENDKAQKLDEKLERYVQTTFRFNTCPFHNMHIILAIFIPSRTRLTVPSVYLEHSNYIICQSVYWLWTQR